jgi:hypothetical protein
MNRDLPPPDYPVARCLDLIGAVDERGKRDTLVRLYRATRTIMSDFIPPLPTDLRFREFKASLTPTQAIKVADKTRSIGIAARDATDDGHLDDMAFMLIAATLHARGGSAWVQERETIFIDKMIDLVETIVDDDRSANSSGER